MSGTFLPVLRWTAAALALLCHSSWGQVAPSSCGPIKARWDYRYASPQDRHEVEGAHFPPVVEHLIRGNRGYLGGDISYTLRSSPNHHRALVTAVRYGEKMKSLKPRDLEYPIECYFERGIRFAPDDHIVRLLYAQFLIGQARPEEAAKQLEYAATIVGDNGFALHNIGMLYADMKDYAKARAYAYKAAKSDVDNPALRQRLVTAGQWQDEPEAASSAEPAASGVKE